MPSLICSLVKEAGIEDFDIEIWNELTFGTKFLTIDNYDDAAKAKEPDFLNPGGRCWELARRTVEAVKQRTPEGARASGASPTRPSTTARSPSCRRASTGRATIPTAPARGSCPSRSSTRTSRRSTWRASCPTVDIRMPEGWAHTFIQTECLIRLLNPEARQAHPEGTQRFFHYMTEHGVVPAECGITDEAGAWELKSKCALRSFCLWLNKGVDVMHFFNAYRRTPWIWACCRPIWRSCPPTERSTSSPRRR